MSQRKQKAAKLNLSIYNDLIFLIMRLFDKKIWAQWNSLDHFTTSKLQLLAFLLNCIENRTQMK